MKKTITFCTFLLLPVLFAFSQKSITITGPAVACQGASVAFISAVSGGVTPLSYQWKKNTNIIPYATGSNYIITYATQNDNGSYTVTISYDSSGIIKNLTSLPHAFSVNLLHTLVLTSGMQNQSVCDGDSLITTGYTFGGGATGATVTSLPSGLTYNQTGNPVIIIGIPTAAGTYTVTTSGNNCQSATISGTVTITAQPTLVLTAGQKDQTVCNGSTIVTTSYTFGGSATGVTVTSLPSGMNSSVTGNTLSISGTPTASGTYTVTTSGSSCLPATISGTITIVTPPALSLLSGLQNQRVCAGVPIIQTVYAYGNGATAILVNNLPAGLTSNVDTSHKTLTITGSPVQSGVYTVSTVSPCTNISLNGSVELITPMTLSPIHGDNSVCSNQQGVVYRIDSISNVKNYSWSVTGGSIVEGNGTTEILVNWGLVSMSGSVRVTVDDTAGCSSVQTLIVPVSQTSAINPNDIIARSNANGETFMLLYPNPPEELFYQWYKNDGMIEGANEQFYYPPLVAPGTLLEPNTDYRVYIAPATNRDCGNFTKVYRFKIGKKDALVIAPNPNDGNFMISLGNEITDLAGSLIEIISMDGKTIRMVDVNDKRDLKMNLNLQNGFYVIKLITSQGETFVRSFIVR
jgi:hypothetical protein